MLGTCAPCSRKDLGLPEEVKLLPEAPGDGVAARLALFAARDGKFSANSVAKRRKLLNDDIFAAAPAASTAGARGGDGASTSGRASFEAAAAKAVAKPVKRVTIGVVAGSTASARAKQQQVAALMAASRKRGLLEKAAAQPAQAQQRKPLFLALPKS
jgi:hypothetical protein